MYLFMQNMSLLMPTSLVMERKKGILNDIVECNAFLFMRTLKTVYPHWLYRLVISHKCNELDLELKDGGNLTLC